ncbi:hypothetical protein [Aliamphritea spongicola]|uniref:hypothetical protein n=1 Tax=Aliamphritea spongicola TaxID=707589 RepID=UPI00196AF110|nr:hypothetical protein [Aliamphritea spongicola]MBN3563103.1 hypothetical protein [Aliamphritea spongicola]
MLAHRASQPQAVNVTAGHQNKIRIVLKQPKQMMCVMPVKAKPQSEPKPSYDFVGIAG